MNPYDVLEIKESYQDLNEFYSEESDEKIKKSYISLKKACEDTIKACIEKYQLSEDDVIGEDYSSKVERAFGEIDKENDWEHFNECVEEIEEAEETIRSEKAKLQEIEEAYNQIKKPEQRIIEYASHIKSEKSKFVSKDGIKFEDKARTAEFRKMIFDELGFITLTKDNSIAKIEEYLKTKKILKGLSKEEIKELKEYLQECFEMKSEMKTIELPNMPDGIKMYIKPAGLDVEYTVTPENVGDAFGIYDLTVVNADGKEMTKKVFTEKNSVLQKMLENPIYLKKLSKTIFSLENINYALRENNGFLGIPVVRQPIFKQNDSDVMVNSYIGYQWDPNMNEAVKTYIENEKEKSLNDTETPENPEEIMEI